ncbi:hypothetical protein AB0D32_09450 [Micromonospora sp. NPDC048170]|uniref:hypothetical protein n=1 Tax=Micromonospora sp. NPDC048170 TaxID=3154819 RepID=UPI00340F8D4C
MNRVELLAEAEICLGLAVEDAIRQVRWSLANGDPDPLVPFVAARWWIPECAMNLMEVRLAGWLLEVTDDDERDTRYCQIYMSIWDVAGPSAGEWAEEEAEEEPVG